MRPGALAAVLVALTACGGGGATASKGRATSTTTTTAAAAVPAGTSTTTAASAPCRTGLSAPPTGTVSANEPTAIAFAPDGRLFFAERSGTVRVFQGGTSAVFARVSTVTTEPGGGYSERGLLGLAISPTFDTDRFVYAFYSKQERAQQEVIRWTDCAGAGTNPTSIVELPAGPDCCHKGGRLAFGPDGKLYVTLGEEHDAPAAQDTSDVRGKVLRYNPDGSIPADNPFGPSDPVWAYGFRNPFGIAFSQTGQLAVTNNGPTGDAGSPSTGYDTVVASVVRGRGYQWPDCYGYSHALGSSGGCGRGESEPDWSSESNTVVPTGAAFVDRAGPTTLAGHLVFCTYTSGMKILDPGSPHATVVSGPSQCRLDVKQGPDRAVYYSDDAHIYRLA